MRPSKSCDLSRLIRNIVIVSTAALTSACSEAATQPAPAPTSFVSIVVSCDVAVQRDAGQWRVNYCTLSLSGGLIGSSLIMPDDSRPERMETLRKFGACLNRKTQNEQQGCYEMLEP